jgi:hypothetical protein
MKPISEIETIRDMAASLERLAAGAGMARVAYFLRLAVLAAAATVVLAAPAESSARCHKIWHYPYPQRCAVSRETPARHARFVAQVKPPAPAATMVQAAAMPVPDIERERALQTLKRALDALKAGP